MEISRDVYRNETVIRLAREEVINLIKHGEIALSAARGMVHESIVIRTDLSKVGKMQAKYALLG